MERNVVIIDYGHGGVFRGKYQTAGKQYEHQSVFPPLWIGEGIINRMLAARVMKKLLARHIDVYDCVANKPVTKAPTWLELEQTDVALSSRAASVNRVQREAERKHAPVVSIHCNAMGMSGSGKGYKHRGASVWTSRGQTQSDGLAEQLWRAFVEHKGLGIPIRKGDVSDGDNDHEADFHMLKRTYGVAVLLECGYFTNIDDAKLLMSREGQRSVSSAIVDGICRWLFATRRS